MAHIDLPHNHGQLIEQVMSQIPAGTEFQKTANLLRQLGDYSRLRLFWILCHCEECVINLSAMMGMSSPAVSHHLKQLRVSGLIVSRRDGKEVYYQAADTEQVRLLHLLVEHLITVSCPQPTGQLKKSAEGGACHCGKPDSRN